MMHCSRSPVALAFGGVDEKGIVLALLRARRDALQRELDGMAAERQYHVAQGHFGAVGVAVFRRGEHLRAAEIAWIDETLPALEADVRKSKARAKGAR